MNTKKIRLKAFLTQKKFAKELGVCTGTVRGWEQGINNPNITQLGKLSQFCERHKIEFDVDDAIKPMYNYNQNNK